MSSVAVDETQMELLLKDVVETLDADGNGEVDLKEFVEGSLKVKTHHQPSDQGNLLRPKVGIRIDSLKFRKRNDSWVPGI